MTIQDPNLPQGGGNAGAGDALVTDLLIARSVDGEASDQQWAMLEHAADDRAMRGDAMLWRRLAMSYRDAQLVRQGVERGVGALAEGVDLPSVREAMAQPVMARIGPEGESSRGWSRWSGWGVAAAALLTLAVVSRSPNQRPGGVPSAGVQPVNGVQSAGLDSVARATFASAAEALDAYLDRGRAEGVVVGEGASRQVLEYAALPEGGYEVFYVRPIIERATVQDLYQLGLNEAGEFRPVPVRRETVPVAPRKTTTFGL